MWILGLESSCDDCSAAVVEETPAGPVLHALVRKSQDDLHGPYGGVVPELAAREHLLQLRAVIGEALHRADRSWDDLDRIAVTQGPGLVGCLLTTFSAAKAIAWKEGLPLVPVHHLLGHLNAARFAAPALPFPALALLVSGGHTHLYRADSWTHLELLQKTRDDAAGEAFDKAARMLNLGYPGGPVVDACGRKATGSAPPFTAPKFRDGKASWSFSGLKTAVKTRIAAEPELAQAGTEDSRVQALCRTLQETVARWLLKPVPEYVRPLGIRSVIVSGGVACNSELRQQAQALAQRLGLELAIPEPRFCTDNGAMIAAAGALLPPAEQLLPLNADADLRLTV
ncbi:MAG: tRNA (adenosine(37)-N6)-threonylcarbamoyltransferase complex transferase subunit TsaD [Firmicutes bacterium]|nr:tRNA (adenosine(37)-N6)-threonylcarbamoyltransferase complex transferase subunit TsaD [Bacillota bacterium]